MPVSLNRHNPRALAVLALFGLLQACALRPSGPGKFDVLIVNGNVYDGSLSTPQIVSVGIRGDRITYVGEAIPGHRAHRVIDASGSIVAPGFIDPHTHSLADLQNPETRHNLNYLTQGVTTVVVGNDGGGDPEITTLSAALARHGIGTNIGFLAGHGSIRRAVIGDQNRAPTAAELRSMRTKVRRAMEQGALGLSGGLYYTPGAFAETAELVDLASVVAEYDGIYDTHIRDESSYSVGLVEAIGEAIEIGRASGVRVNISHIKALGVDVWGQSRAVIDLIETAREDGIRVTADQYPWKASGTSIRGALIPNDYPGMSDADYPAVLETLVRDGAFIEKIGDNLRRRGGPDSILITAAEQASMLGQSLTELAAELGITPVQAVFTIERAGGARIASFNMSADDIEQFMSRPWVMTSSDGSTGHPRKYASYPMKFQTYVGDRKLLSVEAFIHRSTALVADTFKLRQRGRILPQAYADIVIFDPRQFGPLATYANPTRLSTGVEFLLVNGIVVIADGEHTRAQAGRVISRADCRLSRSCQQSEVLK